MVYIYVYYTSIPLDDMNFTSNGKSELLYNLRYINFSSKIFDTT